MAYFAASADPAEVNKKFAESLEADYPILSDPTKETARAYGLVSGPSRVTFYIGKDDKILHIDRGVKTGTHGADIAAKLKELGVEARK